MGKKLPDKIQKAIERGDIIPYEKVWESFSKAKQERIKQKVHCLQAAMELRRLRKDVNYSQEKLAEKMNVKREFISRIESGVHNITLDTLYRVGEATGKELQLTFK
jgi:DNA-binding XRE family transcriptional regulator